MAIAYFYPTIARGSDSVLGGAVYLKLMGEVCTLVLFIMCMLCIQGQEERGGVRTALHRTEEHLKDIKNVAETLYVN